MVVPAPAWLCWRGKQLVLLCVSTASAGAQPALAQGEKKHSTKNPISQGVPVVPRDGVPVLDSQVLNSVTKLYILAYIYPALSKNA